MENYEIIKVIGEGNYGKAVLVKNVNDKSLYVIKSIDLTNFNKEQIENALYEVDVIKNLQHPFIVKYVESFYEDNFLCIVMEYADCGDLYKLIKSQKKINILLKEEIILNWFVQLCFAVKYIHEKNILHRDLKLSNIFLCSNGDIKLGDFGISKMLDDKEQYAKTIVGTPYYLSPEICMKQPYNRKSDIWSMGCILYEMMNLKHAFEASNIGELILKILKGEHDPLHESYSEEIKSLVKEMLNVDTKKRPDIDFILEKPFIMRYIKLNLIRQISNPQNQSNKKTTYIQRNDSIISDKEIITRSNSSLDSGQLNLNLKFNSIPSVISDSQSQKNSITPTEEITMYKIESDNSSKASSNRLTIGKNPPKKPVTNKDLIDKNDKNSVFSKIEKLKKFLENFMGLENFLEMYFRFNEYYLNKESELNIDFEKYNIRDDKTKSDIVKLIKSLIKLENDMFNQ